MNLKDFKIFKVIKREHIWMVAFFVLSFLTVFFFTQGDREVWQGSKDVGYRKGLVCSLLLVFVLRKVSLKKIETWIVAVLGVIGLFVFNAIKNVSPATYGVDYFRVFHYTNMAYILFAALMIDLIRDIKKVVKSINWFGILFLVFVIWAVINSHSAFIPLICPAVAFATTVIDKDDRKRFMDLFAGAYYLVFLYMMALSFFVFPTNLSETGRYVGPFLSEATGTSFCGGALMVGLYFVVRFFSTPERKWYKGVIAILMAVAPVIPVVMIASRSAEFGVILALLGFFIFMVGKKSGKAILIRALCAVFAVALMLGVVIGIASNAAKEIAAGEYKSEEHDYLYNHIAVLMVPEMRSGYFGEDSILNALDSFASERLKIWDASLKIAEPFGKPYTGIRIEWNDWGTCSSPHSFFIWMIVTYGIIGAIFLFGWYIAGIVYSLVRFLRSDVSAALSFLWFLFCIGPFGGITMYWQAPIAFVLLIIQFPLCHKDRKAVEENVG